jgi:hypothetical protein
VARCAVSRTNRSRLRRRVAIASAVCLACLAIATPARAAVTIGQLPSTPPAPSCSGIGSDYLQTSVTGGNLYSARAAGTITSWSTNSSGAGDTYVFKVFRRTSDPDAFQVVGKAIQHTLTGGTNTFGTDLQVESGDLIGLHEEGGLNSCTFPMPGDGVLRASGDLDVGGSGTFGPVPDVRLNLSAVLAPNNAFTITSIVRHRRNGTATLTIDLPNPGVATIGGKGLKRRHVSTAVKTQATLNAATIGKSARKLARKGHLKVRVVVTFSPTGGDPSTQSVPLKLVQPRVQPAV